MRLAAMNRGKHRDLLGQRRETPASQSCTRDMGEHRPVRQHQEPGSEFAPELLIRLRAGSVFQVEPVADTPEAHRTDLSPDRVIASSHPTRLPPRSSPCWLAARALWRVGKPGLPVDAVWSQSAEP